MRSLWTSQKVGLFYCVDAEKHKRIADDEKIKAFVGFKIERDDIIMDENNLEY